MAKSKILYSETQRFSQWWLWVFLIGINALILYAIIEENIAQQHLSNNLTNIVVQILVFLLTVSMSVFFLANKLNTAIATDGIYVRFFPFHRKYKFYAWDDIQEAYTRKYKPIAEYGGWGLRHKRVNKDIAYNVSGNMGLQLVLKNGKKILIGTRKPELVQEALEKVKNYQQIGKSI